MLVVEALALAVPEQDRVGAGGELARRRCLIGGWSGRGRCCSRLTVSPTMSFPAGVTRPLTQYAGGEPGRRGRCGWRVGDPAGSRAQA